MDSGKESFGGLSVFDLLDRKFYSTGIIIEKETQSKVTDYKYRFSIVMAVYNVELFLDEAIQSVLHQTIGFKDNVQMILVDDGSTDNSGRICDNYVQKYPANIMVIHKENGGVSSARNAGIPFAQGKYVNFLDSDDKLTPETLAAVYGFFEENYEKVDIVSIPLSFFDGQTGEHILNYKYAKGTRIIDLHEEFDCIQLHIASSFIKWEYARAIHFDERLRYAEDAKECQKILLEKMKLGVVTEGLYQYRKRSAGEHSAIQKSGTTKDWYIDCLEFFWQEVLDYAKVKTGFIPRFIQYTVMYDLQWRIKRTEKQLKSVLTEEEILRYRKRLADILSLIEDEIILKQKNIGAAQKCYLLSKKHDLKPVYVKRNKDIAIYVNRQFVANEKNIFHAKVLFMKFLESDLTLEGVIYSLVLDDLSAVEIFLQVNDCLVPCNIFRPPHEKITCLGETVAEGIGFVGTIRNYRRYSSFEIRICFCYKGLPVERKQIQVGKFFPVTKAVKNAYAYQNGYLFTVGANYIRAVKAGTMAHIQQEYRFLKELKGSDKPGSNNAIIMRCLYHIAKLFKKRPLWLVSDRLNKADDNGEALFKYLNEKKVPENVYFVIRKDSADYDTVIQYGKVLNYLSLKHKLLQLLADFTISSAGNEFVSNPFGKEGIYYQDILSNQKYIFLQHGIAKDDLSGWLHRYSKNLSLFITSALQEYQSILTYPYQYNETVVKLTGLPRHDRLYSDKKKIIAIMPTWRLYLTDETRIDEYAKDGLYRYDEEFVKNSSYFIFYNTLLNSEELLEMGKRFGYRIKFMPHPNTIPYIDYFHKNVGVEFCSVTTKYREIFAESALIVTDYSSVAFDFAYLRKPVVYCQFDKEEFFYHHSYTQGYFDYERDGFGEVTYNLRDTINCIIEYMKNGCKLKPKYRERIDVFFAYSDKHNCDRVYREIKNLEASVEVQEQKKADEKICLLPDILWNQVRRKADFEQMNALERAELHKFITARIDIKNFGNEENTVEIRNCSDSSAWINYPAWFANMQGKGAVIQSSEGKMDMEVMCVGSGELRLSLRGVDFRDKSNQRIPVWIEYTRLQVEGEDVFAGSHPVWHDRPFVYKKPVADGQKIRLSVEWKAFDESAFVSRYLPLLTESLRERFREETDKGEKSPYFAMEDLKKYITARVDLKNHGTEGNKVHVVSCSDISAKTDYPAWYKNEQGQGATIHSSEGKMDMEVMCVGSGELRVNLRGMNILDENKKRIPVWIEYTRLQVESEDVFTGSHPVWHDKSFVYKKPVADGQKVWLSIEWKAFDEQRSVSG